ncbi:MAG: LysM peptidoglycan-binding domain-containing protein [Anaerolineales bacterium]
MYKKVLIVFSIAVAVIFTLAACNRLAPQSPVGAVQATPTSGGSVLATPLPTGMSLMEAWGTSTAIYIQTEVATGLFTAVPTSGAPQTSSTANPAGTTSTPMVPPTGVGTVVAGIATDTPMPGTTPAVIVPTPTPGHPATYTLQSGEFPWCIARRFNVDPNELLSLNGLTDGQTLQPGLVLNIPQTGPFPGDRALHSHPTTYTVAVNDTFYSIACYFGDVDPSAIAAANNLSLSSTLTTGQTLNIP